jgi:membrane fusion protein, multidrug efflux system
VLYLQPFVRDALNIAGHHRGLAEQLYLMLTLNFYHGARLCMIVCHFSCHDSTVRVVLAAIFFSTRISRESGMPLSSKSKPALLLITALVIGLGLAGWKYFALQAGAGATPPEMPEAVTVEAAQERDYQPTTTSIGTVLAMRSIVLRNELAGTVRTAALKSGALVKAGDVLVQLDNSVEEAELAAQKADAKLAEARLNRSQQLVNKRAASQEELEQTQAQYSVILAQIERTKAVIARKILRAPFPARVGIADVHTGQYLEQGTQLTTLQGIDKTVHVDFAVPQQAAAGLEVGDSVEVISDRAVMAKIVAIDARVDQQSRNAMVRAETDASSALKPGASVRVKTPTGPAQAAITVPVNALRRGPEGDHVFVIVADKAGTTRAKMRPVQAGAVLGDAVQILTGLKVGEKIATKGSFKLREDALVAVAAPDAAAALTSAP